MKFQHSLATFVQLFTALLFSTNYNTVQQIQQHPVSHNIRQNLLFAKLLNNPLYFYSFLHNETDNIEELYSSEENARAKCTSALSTAIGGAELS